MVTALKITYYVNTCCFKLKDYKIKDAIKVIMQIRYLHLHILTTLDTKFWSLFNMYNIYDRTQIEKE